MGTSEYHTPASSSYTRPVSRSKAKPEGEIEGDGEDAGEDGEGEVVDSSGFFL